MSSTPPAAAAAVATTSYITNASFHHTATSSYTTGEEEEHGHHFITPLNGKQWSELESEDNHHQRVATYQDHDPSAKMDNGATLIFQGLSLLNICRIGLREELGNVFDIGGKR